MRVGWVKGEAELSAQTASVVGVLLVGVADQSAPRVDPFGRPSPRNTVNHREVPDTEVDEGVVASANQCQVVNIRSTAVTPPIYVMAFAPSGRRGAAGDCAAAVAGIEGAALGRADGSGVTAEIEDGAVGGEEHSLQKCVAGKASEQLWPDGA